MSDAKEQDAAPAEKKGGKKKLILIVAIAAVLLAGGSGAAWYFLKAPADGDEEVAAADSAKKAPPVFSPMDPFTVNLADGERMAQIGVTLELRDAKTGDALKDILPAVRNGILLLISSKRADELLTLAGKEQLATQIAELTGEHLGWTPEPEEAPEPKTAKGAKGAKEGKAARKPKAPPPNPVVAVHFAQFIVQ